MLNGPAKIIIDGNAVCDTKFCDLIEVMGGTINKNNHPVGRHN